jgi:hypothetical protein
MLGCGDGVVWRECRSERMFCLTYPVNLWNISGRFEVRQIGGWAWNECIYGRRYLDFLPHLAMGLWISWVVRMMAIWIWICIDWRWAIVTIGFGNLSTRYYWTLDFSYTCIWNWRWSHSSLRNISSQVKPGYHNVRAVKLPESALPDLWLERNPARYEPLCLAMGSWHFERNKNREEKSLLANPLAPNCKKKKRMSFTKKCRISKEVVYLSAPGVSQYGGSCDQKVTQSSVRSTTTRPSLLRSVLYRFSGRRTPSGSAVTDLLCPLAASVSSSFILTISL